MRGQNEFGCSGEILREGCQVLQNANVREHVGSKLPQDLRQVQGRNWCALSVNPARLLAHDHAGLIVQDKVRMLCPR